MRAILIIFALISCATPEADLQGPSGSRDSYASGSAPSESSSTQGLPGAVPPAPLSTQAIAALTDELDHHIDRSSSTYGVHVIDLDNGQIVYTRGADRWLKPASNAKLFTTAAAMELLGVDHRPQVELWATSEPVGDNLAGDLLMVGQHDGTWSSWMHRDPDVPADRLAAALRRRGVRTISGGLVARGEYVYEPHRFGTYAVAPHRSAAASAMRDALDLAGITVGGSVSSEPGFEPPSGWVHLHTWRGSSLEAISAPINRISHNEITDLLGRHLGFQIEGQSTYAGGEAAIASWLADRGLDTSGFSMFDASGLSHSNRVSARLVAELMQALDESPSYGAFVRSLAVAGSDGTLAGRLDHPDTSGRFLGKTGTLRDTIATSGILHNRHDGHRYAIAILANDVSSQATARSEQDTLIRVLGRDWREGDTGRPSRPEAATLMVDGSRLHLSWIPGPRTDATEVWISDDGATWTRDRAYEVTGDQLTLRGLTDQAVHIRLIGISQDRRSEPSTTLAARGGSGERVLVVDGYERWFVQAENPLGSGHDFVSRVVEAADGVQVHTATNRAILDGEVALGDYDGVFWLLGEESTQHATFTKAEQALVRAYVDSGGAFIASGSEIGWDLEAFGDSEDISFLREVLGGRYLEDSSETYMIEPAEPAFAALDDLSFLLPGHMLVFYPDLIEPVGSSRIALAYAGGTGGGAVLRRTDAPVMWAGFPLEAIDDAVDRRALIQATLRVLDLK